MTTKLYGPADVAAALGVSRPAVTNWHRRGLDTPPPDHVTVDGRAYWYDLAPWHAWHGARQTDAERRAEAAAERRAEAAAERLRRARAALERAERAAARAGVPLDR